MILRNARIRALVGSLALYMFAASGVGSAAGIEGTWTPKTSMSTARWGLGTGVVNGIVYAIGGYDNSTLLRTNEAYDPSSNTWTTKSPMPTARYLFGVSVVNGILYAMAGGCTGAYCVPGVIEAYDPSSNGWTTKSGALTPRAGPAAGAINGVIYAAGGYNGLTLDTVEAYNPVTDTVTPKAPLLTARYYASGSVVNGIFYVIGGSTSSNVVGTVEAYNPVTDTWTAKAPMPTARAGLATGVVNGIIYAIGGYDLSGNVVGTVEAYDPATNTWTTKPPMLTPRDFLGVGVVNRTLYAVGGADEAGAPLVANEAFTLPTALISYAANLQAGDSKVNLTNTGAVNGYEPAGNICANVYVFAEDQQLIACCACQLTPNHLQTLSAQNDLISNTLTPGVPIGITTMLVASTGTCDAANPGPPADGLLAWGTTLHALPGGGFGVTETRFLDVLPSDTELAKMTQLCGFIEANGSGYGICNSCKTGAAGARKQ